MRILFAGPQLGAVADLAVALQRLGHEVAALLPFDEDAAGRTRPTRVQIPIAIGSSRVVGEILQASGPEKLPCYLIRTIQPLAPGSAAPGIFHSQLAVELARRLIPSPDVLQLCGWESALAPAYVRRSNLPFRTVLDLQDVGEQGSFDGTDFALAHLPAGFFSPGGAEFFGRLNFLKGGLVLAHAFTVNGRSRLAAWQREPAGAGLSAVLAEQSQKAAPILCPPDAAAWNPALDAKISRNFSHEEPAGKSTCRAALLASLELAKNSPSPILLWVRDGAEESDEMLAPILDRWLTGDGRLVVLTSDAVESAALEAVARRAPAGVRIVREPDDAMSHRAVAGADFQIFPGAPTPEFATSAWRALRYGTIPLARDHAGRSDLFDDSTHAGECGGGLAWFVDSPAALWDTLGCRAEELHRDPDRLEAIRIRAMKRAAGVTLASAAEAHIELYRRLGVA